jgi:putative tryptophan/tyrosine transport system substrate-binding protein
MNRREVMGLIATAVVVPLGASAQEAGRVYRLGFLVPATRASTGVVAFFDELRQFGFVEGRNLTVIPGGFGINDQFEEHAQALVRAEPDAIVGGSVLHMRALQRATGTVPLFGMSEDLVAEGLVSSLARPGGNTTGISLLSRELDGKRQDILIEAAPTARQMVALFDESVTPQRHVETLRERARARAVEVVAFGVTKVEEIVPAIDKAKASGAEALNFLAGPLFFVHSRLIIDYVAAVRLPAIFQWPNMAEDGGLAAYGPRFSHVYRQRARMVVKALLGTKPIDIPVELPTSFVLVINLKTARALGHEIPQSLLVRADEVIE